MAQWVLASDGSPFTDRDAATIKRDLLSRELGAGVQLDVVPHPAGGYAVECSRPAPAHGARSFVTEDERLEPVSASLEGSSAQSARARPRVSPLDAECGRTLAQYGHTAERSYPDVFRLSPAARAFLGQHVLALSGAYFLFRPQDFLRLVGVGVPESPQLAALGLGAVMFGSLLLAMVSVTRFLWAYTANTYLIDHSGVVQVQWYFERYRLRRRAPRVNFAHLRTVDVNQTVLQMLLDIGTLRLASGATDTYELVLSDVRSPRQLQTEFQRRLREATAPARATRRESDL